MDDLGWMNLTERNHPAAELVRAQHVTGMNGGCRDAGERASGVIAPEEAGRGALLFGRCHHVASPNFSSSQICSQIEEGPRYRHCIPNREKSWVHLTSPSAFAPVASIPSVPIPWAVAVKHSPSQVGFSSLSGNVNLPPS